jgi:hypothetical protein
LAQAAGMMATPSDFPVRDLPYTAPELARAQRAIDMAALRCRVPISFQVQIRFGGIHDQARNNEAASN